MPLGYKPEAGAGEPQRWEPRPGRYAFKVESVTEKTFSTGNRGVEVILLVDAGGKYDSKVYDNITYVETSQWRLRHLCEAVGVAYDPPPEAFELVGRLGMADFKTEKNGEYTNLKVKDYVPRDEPSEGVAKEMSDEGDPLPF